jgi:hypothetical protein
VASFPFECSSFIGWDLYSKSDPSLKLPASISNNLIDMTGVGTIGEIKITTKAVYNLMATGFINYIVKVDIVDTG